VGRWKIASDSSELTHFLWLQILINTKINTKIENTGIKNTRRTRRRTGRNPSIATGKGEPSSLSSFSSGLSLHGFPGIGINLI
jgi:hypothetical protein